MRCLKEEGFTLIELIMAIVILGITTALIIPRLTNVGGANVGVVARQIQSHIRYAQEIAMSKYKAKGITFTPGQRDYSFSPADDPTDPPATQRRIPSNSRVSIDSTSNGANPVTFTFNSLGEPTSVAGSSVTLRSSGGETRTITIQARTGRVIIQ